eukprot:CAMPEP_0197660032 /NCGR_PEP_ID=MMETSP1338-20131121/50151_1 /TAXON_ID=43686 ORGANISM="Pelagodinium beii, Strain RCC1491" /NCGR_SAMPLE_ID=MMETSP1338 /ASSEMBLY_ACC=CAM_ASM_000754 /LENGTH=34 /DNA_ID= /DNA_START= /DNA_END= /DNA_ORIENTATION=
MARAARLLVAVACSYLLWELASVVFVAPAKLLRG